MRRCAAAGGCLRAAASRAMHPRPPRQQLRAWIGSMQAAAATRPNKDNTTTTTTTDSAKAKTTTKTSFCTQQAFLRAVVVFRRSAPAVVEVTLALLHPGHVERLAQSEGLFPEVLLLVLDADEAEDGHRAGVVPNHHHGRFCGEGIGEEVEDGEIRRAAREFRS